MPTQDLPATLGSLLGPLVLPQSYESQNLRLGAVPPNADHWLGADTLGRDLLVRIIYGGQISIAVGLRDGVALTIGVLYGTISGFLGGKVDVLMMRIVDIIFALPFTVFVILLMVFFGRKFMLIFAAIGAVQWLTMARIVRGQVLFAAAPGIHRSSGGIRTFKNADHFSSYDSKRARADNCLCHAHGSERNVLEAFLSFLGLGVQPPMSSWGVLIKEGADSMEEFPWLLIYPGLPRSYPLLA